jgi:hypothetical protein
MIVPLASRRGDHAHCPPIHATTPRKHLEAAEGRWRAVNGPHLVALVRAGAKFEKGRLVERPKEAPDEDTNEVAA